MYWIERAFDLGFGQTRFNETLSVLFEPLEFFTCRPAEMQHGA